MSSGKADSAKPPRADSVAPPRADSVAPPQADSVAPPQADSVAPPQADSVAPPQALLVDYGGVLTGPLTASFESFEQDAGLEPGTVVSLLSGAYDGGDGGMVGQVERGEIDRDELTAELAAALSGGEATIDPEGLLERLFGAFEPGGPFWSVVEQAADGGIVTGLLSNSWGVGGYPRERIDGLFDTVLISGEVGLRKPDPAIFRLAAERVGVPLGRCAFVDDFPANTTAARRLGMHAVYFHHDELDRVVADLSEFFGVDLDVPVAVVDADGQATGR